MTRPLAVLGQTLEALVDESHIGFVDVQTKQTQATGGTTANTVEKLECFMHQVVIGLTVVLLANVVLEKFGTLVKMLFLSSTDGKKNETPTTSAPLTKKTDSLPYTPKQNNLPTHPYTNLVLLLEKQEQKNKASKAFVVFLRTKSYVLVFDNCGTR